MFTLSTVLLATSLVAASPLQRRSAAVIPLAPRSTPATGKVFDAEAAKLERARVVSKYTNQDFVPSTDDAVTRKRAFKSASKPFDIRRRGEDGKEPLVDVFNQIDQMYYGTVEIGSPAQSTTIDFDTGSSDLWVPLSTCSECFGPTFKDASSSTFKNSATPFTVQYQDGSAATGTVATESVTVAGLTVEKQGMGAVTNETGNFLQGPSAGLMGLGFPANAQSGATPFFISLAKAGKLASNVFSFYMSRGGSQGSELCFGCTDSDKYTGSIKSYPLDSKATQGTQYYWNIPSEGVSYDGGAPSGAFSAVIDSGTTLVYIPTAAAKELFSKVPGSKPAPAEIGAGFYTFPCNATLGAFSLSFGDDIAYAVDPQDLNLGMASDNSTDCVSGIIGEDVGGMGIVGDEFMKSWYSVFDYDKMAVGFAKAI